MGRLDARRRALYLRARQPVRLVPDSNARRAHQPLGTDFSQVWPGRLPPEEPRRTRRRLAHHLRRPQAVLRRGGQARRDLRIRREPAERAGRHLPAAAAPTVLRAARQAGGGSAEDHLHSQPSVDPHAAAERPAGVPLLRAVRPGLRHPLELLVAVRAPASGAQDRPPDDRHRRDGARGHDRRDGSRHRRQLRGQENRTRYPRAGAGRRAGGQRVRVGANPPELEVLEVSARAGQRKRRRSAST